MNHQEFWNDNEVAQKVLQENKNLKETVDEYNKLKESLEEIEILIEIGLEENDDSIEKEIEKKSMFSSKSPYSLIVTGQAPVRQCYTVRGHKVARRHSRPLRVEKNLKCIRTGR